LLVNSIDDSNIFPALKSDELEKWGSILGEQYEYLTKVVLYDPPLKYPIDAYHLFHICKIAKVFVFSIKGL